MASEEDPKEGAPVTHFLSQLDDPLLNRQNVAQPNSCHWSLCVAANALDYMGRDIC